MDMPRHSPIFVSTQTAALLTGKSVRTIHNWLESGVVMGRAVPAAHIQRAYPRADRHLQKTHGRGSQR